MKAAEDEGHRRHLHLRTIFFPLTMPGKKGETLTPERLEFSSLLNRGVVKQVFLPSYRVSCIWLYEAYLFQITRVTLWDVLTFAFYLPQTVPLMKNGKASLSKNKLWGKYKNVHTTTIRDLIHKNALLLNIF